MRGRNILRKINYVPGLRGNMDNKMKMNSQGGREFHFRIINSLGKPFFSRKVLDSSAFLTKKGSFPWSFTLEGAFAFEGFFLGCLFFIPGNILGCF
jgi:hypothetical protein